MSISLLTLISCQDKETEIINVLVGTYTKNLGFVDGKGEGIYQLTINLETGKLENSVLLNKNIENPSYVRKAGEYYIAVSEINGDERSPYGRVNILNKDMSGGRSFVTNGTSPCHIGISKDGDLFGVANYNGGALIFYTLNKELEPVFPKVFNYGCEKSAHPRQDASHIHSVLFSPDGVHIASADLGCDVVRIFKWENNEVTYVPEISTRVPSGCGPRHLDWTNDGKYYAVGCELSNEIMVYQLKSPGLVISKKSTLPKEFSSQNSVSDIHFHPNNKFVYIANRGHNSIAVFSFSENGKLNPLGHFETKGKTPRNFMITEDGKYLLAANQDSNNITIFTISDDGSLVYKSQIDALTPVCLEQI
jgi:6-phosphogluconolactonase